MNNRQEDVYFSPSFSSYSSDNLAEMAVRVAGDRFTGCVDNGIDDDFEFVLVREDGADEFFYDGDVRWVFPVFDRGLLRIDADSGASGSGDKLQQLESSVVMSLSQLFIEEDNVRDYPPSCSSSDADELEDVPVGEYNVWRSKVRAPPPPSQCEKSRSTGSRLKRWKIRDLLRRSKSDGNNSFVFLTPRHRLEKSGKLIRTSIGTGGKGSQSAAGAPRSPHEAFYVRNRAMKEGDKKKSYLPYKQDLVGFFTKRQQCA